MIIIILIITITIMIVTSIVDTAAIITIGITPNLPTNIVDFRGLDSSIMLI